MEGLALILGPGFAVEGNEKLSSRLVGGRYRAPPFLFFLKKTQIAGWLFPTKKDMGCTLSNHVSRGSALSATFSSRYGFSPGAELR